MRTRFSYRTLIISLYLGSLIPLLVLMGLLVYGIQQTFLLNNARNRISELVQSGIQDSNVTGDNLTRLAVSLGDTLRVIGADVFLKDVQGRPVPPALGTGPWLNEEQHQQALASKTGSFLRLRTGNVDRLVYLAPILDAQGNALGTVEASLTLEFMENELAALRRWLTLVVGGATFLAVALSLLIAESARRPLGGLIRTAGRVAQGDMDSRAPLPDVAEANQLAGTFNLMLDRIQLAMLAQEQTTDEMRRFAADASHELRSPLAVFRNGVEMLYKALERDDKEQVAQVLALLRNEVESMTSLVNDLLLLARMESTQEGLGREVTLTPIEPMPLLEEVYERALLLTQGQELTLVWPEDEIRPLHGDRELIRRALNNLVENAIYHTRPGKHIYLRTRSTANECIFIIQDEGSGIPSEELPHIFERFYRGDSARSRQRPSTGLGLSIVRAVVYAHEGDIQVQSRPNQGTTFSLSFPYRYTQADRASEESNLAPPDHN